MLSLCWGTRVLGLGFRGLGFRVYVCGPGFGIRNSPQCKFKDDDAYSYKDQISSKANACFAVVWFACCASPKHASESLLC